MHGSQHTYGKRYGNKHDNCSTCTSMYSCPPQIIVPPSNCPNVCPTQRQIPTSGIISLSPSEGPVLGNNVILITGYNLIFTTTVSMGGTNIPFTIISNTLLQISAIPRTINSIVNITVYFQNGFSESLPYTYGNSPTIISLTPSNGPIYGSNIITINGTYLSSTKEIYFNTIVTYSFVINSDSILQVAVPNLVGQSNVLVYIVTSNGSSNTLPYTIVPAPII